MHASWHMNRQCRLPVVLMTLLGIGLCPGRTSAAADESGALVIVNGRPISRKKVANVLMESYGLQIMQQLVMLELAKQEARDRGIRVTEQDVEDQFRRALNEIAPQVDAQGAALDEQQKRDALELVLQQRCLTMPEFRIAVERNAHLRKVTEAELSVKEETLREEFARTYGEKAQVRHIQIPTSDTVALHEALDLLGRGRDFAEVARQLSVNTQTAARGGLMEPFAFGDQDLPPELREAAFQLAPGEVSPPVQTGKMLHILKLERRIAPDGVSFADVRDKVEQRLKDRVVRQKMDALITELFRKAQIRVLDADLRAAYRELLEQANATP